MEVKPCLGEGCHTEYFHRGGRGSGVCVPSKKQVCRSFTNSICTVGHHVGHFDFRRSIGQSRVGEGGFPHPQLLDLQ